MFHRPLRLDTNVLHNRHASDPSRRLRERSIDAEPVRRPLPRRRLSALGRSRQLTAGAVCRWKSKLRTLFAALGPYIVEGSGGPFLSRMVSASVGFLNSAAVGVDILSHQKKAEFWRELVELFPNMIDYLCNPNVDPVCYS